ncbi:ABC transporter substrate-binding protein [Paenibacillus nasutitermitis]|uniref:Iron(3+)-hydroxamate-binding protein YxeB n=1 Tax=Paenibacillus nasutitermitis TaxID=1652958 RepID=A0A917E2X4_9BACL|nr:ABC transporter substrate-binding protein [Paenibacillus nasutitermitis]GGD96223.1 iron(3+)-hydroxamate-binding protein YxeB [Paenibacillus nasutitermitis]
MFMRKSFFITAAIIMILAVLSACGSKNNQAGGGTPAANTTAAGDKNAEAPPEPDNKDEAAAAKLRIFETKKGSVEIPVKPLRIVTDYYGGELLSVGANVVGVEPSAFDNPFIKDLLKDAKDVGAPINVEKTLELAPDLIVVMYEDSYEALSKIAPTLYIPYGTATNIRETVNLFGDITGNPEKAEQFIADYEKKAEEGREKLKGVIDENATLGLYELTDKGDLWIFGDNAGRGGQAVYDALKFKMPHKDSAGEQTLQLSMEALPEYEGDYMFLTTYDPEKKGEQLKQLKESGIWKGLDAAKNNQIFYNDFDTFYRYDPIAIVKQIDLIVDMLLERSAENKK